MDATIDNHQKNTWVSFSSYLVPWYGAVGNARLLYLVVGWHQSMKPAVPRCLQYSNTYRTWYQGRCFQRFYSTPGCLYVAFA